jgi:uncharacterized protein (DUF488 family)
MSEATRAQTEPVGDKRFLPIFTIGHSTHSAERFVALLQAYAIDVVIDVRSSPYSRRAPQFGRPTMKRWLDASGVQYYFVGRALGGRPDDSTLYENGRVSYDRMAASANFLTGLRRVARAARVCRVALVCSEAEPIECHRFLLIGKVLHQNGLSVFHILPNGEAESHSACENRLISAVNLVQSELFRPQADTIAEAYILQSSRVAFTLPRNVLDPLSPTQDK